MLKRLWLVISLCWALFIAALAQWTDQGSYSSRDWFDVLILASGPYLLGRVVGILGRFVVGPTDSHHSRSRT